MSEKPCPLEYEGYCRPGSLIGKRRYDLPWCPGDCPIRQVFTNLEVAVNEYEHEIHSLKEKHGYQLMRLQEQLGEIERERDEAKEHSNKLLSMLNCEEDKAVEKVLSMTDAQIEAVYREQGECSECAVNKVTASAMTAIARVRREEAAEAQQENTSLKRLVGEMEQDAIAIRDKLLTAIPAGKDYEKETLGAWLYEQLDNLIARAARGGGEDG